MHAAWSPKATRPRAGGRGGPQGTPPPEPPGNLCPAPGRAPQREGSTLAGRFQTPRRSGRSITSAAARKHVLTMPPKKASPEAGGKKRKASGEADGGAKPKKPASKAEPKAKAAGKRKSAKGAKVWRDDDQEGMSEQAIAAALRDTKVEKDVAARCTRLLEIIMAVDGAEVFSEAVDRDDCASSALPPPRSLHRRSPSFARARLCARAAPG